MTNSPEPTIVYTNPPSRIWFNVALAISFLTIGLFGATMLINAYAPIYGPPSAVVVDRQPVHTDPPSSTRVANQQVAEAEPAPVPDPELTAGGAAKGATLPLDSTGQLERTIRDLAVETKGVDDPPKPTPVAASPAPNQVSAPPASAPPSTGLPDSPEVQKWKKLMTAWYDQKQLTDQLYQWCQQPQYQAMGLCRK